MSITAKDVERASERLRSVIHRTPIERSVTFSDMSDTDIYLKYENQQKTGSFKIRGAYNKISHLLETEKPSAFISCSAGNHAQGVAFASTSLGVKSVIVMPKSTPIAKVSATEGLGAKVLLHGDCYDDAYTKALELQKEGGYVMVHPFDDYDVIAGQGTVGLEILNDMPYADTIVVPAGGGGLLAGVALYIKETNPKVRVVGVQAQGADAILQSFKKWHPVHLSKVQTIADGIAVKIPGELTMKLINRYVDDMYSVSDDDIAAAILLLMERTKQVVEPAGAASLALALSDKNPFRGQKTACVLSGGNIDVSFIHRIIEKGLIKRGRQIKFSTIMLDIPGSLEHFSKIVAKIGANIIMFQHDRLHAHLTLNEAIIHIVCEVGGPEHSKQLINALEEAGYKITIE